MRRRSRRATERSAVIARASAGTPLVRTIALAHERCCDQLGIPACR
jgi:hypothetical protein